MSAHQRDVYKGNTSSITCPRIRETYTRETLRPSRVRASERRIQGEHFVHHVSAHQRDVYKGNTSSNTCPRIRETYTRGTLSPSRVHASERRIQGEHLVHHVSTHQRDVYKGNTSSITCPRIRETFTRGTLRPLKNCPDIAGVRWRGTIAIIIKLICSNQLTIIQTNRIVYIWMDHCRSCKE